MNFKTILIVAVLATTSTALADWKHGTGIDGGIADWSRVAGCYDGRGGEFTLHDHYLGGNQWQTGSLKLSNAAYASTTSGKAGRPESFQTFCVETGEFINEPMKVWASTQNAALTGPGTHAWEGGAPALGDDLDSKTAYLYMRFAKGTLPGYNYGSGGYASLTRWQTAAALQRLIWNLEQEDTGYTFTQKFMDITLNDDQRTLINTWLTLAQGASGRYNVFVLQTGYNSVPQQYQDQLWLCIPAPAAAMLGAIGLGLVGWVKRRLS